jgi:protein-S-isoprenylcysteine O-methyltransferase Ste14
MTSSPDMAGEPQPTSSRTSTSVVDDLLRDYHDARRREDQWRIPQLLLALATPLVSFISVLFSLAHQDAYAVISGAVAIVTGTGAALIATQVWRWHRTAVGIANRVRDEHPGEATLLLKDPL